MKGTKLILVLGLIGFSFLAKADLTYVSLYADKPSHPTNPFLICLKALVEKENPNYQFVSFAGTEMPFDSATPPMFAKTDFMLEDKTTAKRYLFKVVLQSTDKVKGWQYYQVGSQISLFSRSVSDKVEFSRSPTRSPVMRMLNVSSCPTK